MADVPIYVAAITAGAGIIGALIPQAVTIMREVRQAERDRRERTLAATREACIALLRTAGELRVLAEGIRSYRGDENGVRARVEEARSLAEATQLNAANVRMHQVPDKMAELADQVASVASDLVDDVLRNTDLNQGVPIGDPDVTRLVERIAAFRHEAVGHVWYENRASSRQAEELRRGDRPEGRGRWRLPRAWPAVRRHSPRR